MQTKLSVKWLNFFLNFSAIETISCFKASRTSNSSGRHPSCCCLVPFWPPFDFGSVCRDHSGGNKGLKKLHNSCRVYGNAADNIPGLTQ